MGCRDGDKGWAKDEASEIGMKVPVGMRGYVMLKVWSRDEYRG